MTRYWSKASGGTSATDCLTAAQKTQIINAYKRFAVNHYKKQKIKPGERCLVYFNMFRVSPEYKAVKFAQKEPIIIDKADAIALSKKTATVLRAGGYKVQTEPLIMTPGSLEIKRLKKKR